MDRAPGTSVRLKLTLSYAGFLMIAGFGLMAVVWLFLLRYVPDRAITIPADRIPGATKQQPDLFIPGRSDLWAAFAPKAALMLVSLLVFGLVGGWLLAGRMLAPLNRISAAIRTAGAGSLSHRIQLPGRRDEFRDLADAFDGMLARLEAHVVEQQRFAANASHELRTPLAITKALLEVARKDPNRNTNELLDRLQVVNSRAISLTEALLLLSRADQRSFAQEHVDLSLAAEEAIETLLLLAEKKGITIEISGDPAPTVGSCALLQQMTTNLVHNAIMHNFHGGSVWVNTRADPDIVVLTVENTGEELVAELVVTLTEPFRRGTERIHGDQAGAGLGLAIVKRIVEVHGGVLTIRRRPTGGLCVTVQLGRSAGPGGDEPFRSHRT